MKQCIACGMPMSEAKDFAMQDETKDYCLYCAREDGTMQSFEEKTAGLTSFITRTQGLTEEAAQRAALQMMSQLPAWRDHFAK